ncbi:MAG: ATP-binding protein [Anaerolineales bacterium]|jgi:PAS domain S-box-containing protein|nr:ATP-binding protein [Anaerolineales bacterium]
MAKQELILLAIDNSAILDLMDRALRAAGYAVVISRDQSSMQRSVQDAIPSLLLVGETFGGKDGFSISTGMLERFPTLPIILFANQDTTDFAKSALKLGLSGYLYPPLKMSDIVDEVQRCLVRARGLGDWLRREVKRTTASLEEKNKISESERSRLETIIANIQDGVIVLDVEQNILMINQAVIEIFNLSGRSVLGMPLKKAIQNADLHALMVRSSEGALKYHEVNFDDGRVFNAQYTPIPKVGSAVTMQDISYLKELDRLKNEFIHTISHDLRSPLTAILGYTELIERTGNLNENQQVFLQRLQGSVQHVTGLVNDLLDLGRLESGFDMRREVVSIENVLKYTLDMFDAQIKSKKINVDVKIELDLKPLRANPIRIRQMMDNLVGNAIKYTPSEGRVGIGLFMQNDQLVLRVEDTGPGIPPDEHSRIFEKFYRASNKPASVEGSGLGLAIVKSIVDSHQGRVWVEANPGGGSVFVVLLPAHE